MPRMDPVPRFPNLPDPAKRVRIMPRDPIYRIVKALVADPSDPDGSGGGPGPGSGSALHALPIYIEELPGHPAGEPLLRIELIHTWTLDEANAVASADEAAAAPAVLSIRLDGVEQGTVTFIGTAGVVDLVNPVFPPGVFEVYPPSPADATLDGISITFPLTIS